MESVFDRDGAHLYEGDRVAFIMNGKCEVGSIENFNGAGLISVDGPVTQLFRVNDHDPKTYDLILAYRPDFVNMRLEAEKSCARANSEISAQLEADFQPVSSFLFEVDRVVDTKTGLGVSMTELRNENEPIDYDRGGPGSITIGSKDKSIFDGFGPGEKVLVTLQLASFTPSH